MELAQIKADLEDTDSQKRLKAIAELKNFETETAVPLLISRLEDREFLVRSFVAMGLGKKQNAESFAALWRSRRVYRSLFTTGFEVFE